MAEFNDIYEEETIDIKKYIYKILSNWHWFVITGIISILIAYVVNRYSDRIYSVNSTLLVEEPDNNTVYGNSEMIQGLDMFKQNANIQNQIGILQSFDLTKKVISELDFDVTYHGIGRIREPEVYRPNGLKVNLDTSHYQMYNQPIYVTIVSKNEYMLSIRNDKFEVDRKMKFGEKFENEYFSFNITIRNPLLLDYDEDYARFYFYINDPVYLTNMYRNKLSIGLLDEEGSILNLSIQGYVAEKEVVYLNKLTEVFIRSQLNKKNQIAANTIKFIDEQISAIVDSLTIAEGNLERFRSENKIIDISQEGKSMFDQLTNLEKEQATLTIEAKYYEYLMNYLKSKKDEQSIIVPTSVGVRDQLLVNLILQLNQLNSEKISLTMQSLRTNPRVDLINTKINELKNMLMENVNNLITTNKITYDDILGQITKLNKEIEKLPYNERHLINIKRKFNLNDQIYTYLLEKRAETGISRASNMPSAQVLDKARVELALLISPKKKLNYIIALIIGLMIPFLIIILEDFFNSKIQSKKEIESNTNAPILGVVGHNKTETDFAVKLNPKSPISESFRTIKTNLQYLINLDDNNDCKVITVTSTISGEGKTFCSINLASTMALSDKKTVLIGVDLRRPKLHKHFKVGNNVGLTSYLIGKADISDIITETEIDNLSLIVSGPIPPNPTKLLETKALDNLIEHLKEQYDYIVVDTPPIALVSDAIILTKYSDINLFVIRQNYSNVNVLEFLNDINKKPNMSEFNIIVNDVKTPGYYGYYGYGYDKYYEGYYEEEDKKYPFIKRILRNIKRYS
jgi:capsular exopolysaccharide synthesis family protein